MGAAAALGAALCWAIAPIMFTLGGREIGAVNINRMRLLVACFLLLVTHLITLGIPSPGALGATRLAWLIGSGIMGLAVGDTLLLKALMLIGPRLVTLMMTLVPLMSALLGWFWFGEGLSTFEAGGAILCLTGVMVVVTAHKSRTEPGDRHAFRKGLLLAAGAALGQTLGLLFAKQGLQGDIPVLSAVLVRMLAALAVMWFMHMRQVPFIHPNKIGRRELLLILSGAAIGPYLGVWLSIVAVAMTRIGLAATLMGTTPVLILPLSHWILKERIGWRAVFGSVLTLVGIAIMVQLITMP